MHGNFSLDLAGGFSNPCFLFAVFFMPLLSVFFFFNALVSCFQAWDIYYHVFRKISRQLTTLKYIELRHVAPALPNARGLQLAVPGTYR